MSIRFLRCFALSALLLSPLALPAAESQVLVVTPRASALVVSPSNRPFLASTRVQQPVDLIAAGYVEGEYIVRGSANIYDWSGAQGAAVSVRERDVPYATRILVRRPIDAAKASGLVVLELLDPAGLHDAAPLWGLSWQHFTRRGDVWVGVTVNAAAADTLRRFDGVRYAPLSFRYDKAATCQPTTPTGMSAAEGARANPPDAENGLAWDLIAQVGALLRSSSKENPLLPITPRQVIAAGYGDGAGYVLTFANALHGVQRLGSGAPVFDGYLAAASTDATPLNQCAAPLAADDPRRGALPRDVPFVLAVTESDIGAAPALRRDDSDEPGNLFRRYDIAGSAHAGVFAAGVPVNGDLTIAGLAAPAAGICAETASDYPAGLAFNAIWQQYAEWFNARVPLTHADRIETDAGGQPVRDQNGNAVGGWRLPVLDLPIAGYSGRGTARDGRDARAAVLCSRSGVKHAFNAAKLKSLYRDHTAYLATFRTMVDQAVAQRRLTAEDGEAMKLAWARALPAF